MAKKKTQANGSEVEALPVEEPEEPKNLPVHTIRYGFVRASIWKNLSDDGSARFNVTVSRLYRGNDGMWYTSESFGYNTLLALAKCLDEAHSYIASQYAQDDDTPF